METHVDSTPRICYALYEYTGVADHELSFSRGDTFIVLDTGATDWWYVQRNDTLKETGYVPITYVCLNELSDGAVEDGLSQAYCSPIDVNHHESNDDLDSNSNSYGTADASSDASIDASSCDASSVNQEEIVRDIIMQQKIRRKKSRANLDRHRRKLIEPDTPPSNTNHLPRGFCLSTLSKNLYSGQLRDFLSPELDSSGISFVDLHLDSKNKIREVIPKCNFVLSILDARHVPEGLNNLHICGRHVRMALFDKANILSNIHTIPAIVSETDATWRFSSKSSLLFPKDNENTCFVRTNIVDVNTCILFELCVLMKNINTKKTTQSKNKLPEFLEVSCGWGLIPLVSVDGILEENKTYDITLHGGSPFQKSTDFDESPTKKGLLSGLIFQTKAPRIRIKLWKIPKKIIRKLNHLPQVIIGQLSACTVFSLYRHIQARELVVPLRVQGLQLNTIFQPVLQILPLILEQQDVLDALVLAWNQQEKLLKRSKKLSFTKMLKHFGDTVLGFWTILSTCDIPEYRAGDLDSLKIREKYIKRLQIVGPTEYWRANSTEMSFKAFDIEELVFMV
ncbi:hypothetical protein BASA50_000420 [Batrachochytrium salamandrivorans]|uniref:SH3 domain-containing protein n=1 Tax=Batrachochytrium salamandrivorans TaxID=1357716 RepID=A0ABQ8ETS3_9FUNG|nr:hypothetical protein BASA50_000420 [Batrachochytrium salamandrivorans]